MRQYDFSPLYRSFVGLDRMAGLIDAAAASASAPSNYPPYNVSRLSEDAYRIELAISGFTEDQIDIQTHENVLMISSQAVQNADNDTAEYLHRGIAQRAFETRFQLGDHVEVTDAQLINGLLTISLTRELPDALKPRKITINNALNSKGGEKLITPSSGKQAKAA